MSVALEERVDDAVLSGVEESDDIPVIPEMLLLEAPPTPQVLQDSALVRRGGLLGSAPGLVSNPVIPYGIPHSDDPGEADIESVDLAAGGYLEVVSTAEEFAEAIAFFEREKAKESEGQKARARLRSTVFYIMQYRKHKDTGEVMLTQEQLTGLYDTLEADELLDKRADIWHDSDEFSENDADDQQSRGYSVQTGDLKPLHNHSVLKLKVGCEKSIRNISDRAKIPSARIHIPRELAERDGRKVQTGPTAAIKAFFDGAQYLTHEGGKQAGKHPYSRDLVSANFKFSEELDARTAAGPAPSSKSGGGLAERKRALRRAVGLGRMTLIQAREFDFDAYADDLPRLRKLHEDFEMQPENRAGIGVGKEWRKSVAMVMGPTRQGKGVLVDEIAVQLQSLASLAGLEWSYVAPAGRNALEGVGRAEIVHHDDARYYLLPTYDEYLRYLDPNRATEAATRFKNTPAPAPRAIMVSSSETLFSLGLAAAVRKDRDTLIEGADKRRPVNIDEFLYRIGWYVEVRKPAWIADGDLPTLRKEMMVSIYRLREGSEPHRIEGVTDRNGEYLGDIRTQHRLEQIAIIKGVEHAARFLAVSMIEERSPDVVAAIPLESMQDLTTERLVIELDGRRRAVEHSSNLATEAAIAADIALTERDAAQEAKALKTAALFETAGPPGTDIIVTHHANGRVTTAAADFVVVG